MKKYSKRQIVHKQMNEQDNDEPKWFKIGSRIQKNLEFGEKHDLDLTKEFKASNSLATSSNIPVSKRLRYFEHLVKSHINKQWLADPIEFLAKTDGLGTEFCIPLKRDVIENASLHNDDFLRIQKIVFDALLESECYVEFIGTKDFKIKFFVPYDESDVAYLNITFSKDKYFLNEKNYKKTYSKRQIVEAIKYWTGILESMDDDKLEVVLSPEILDRIYGKSIYNTAKVEFSKLVRKAYLTGKPEDCYPDEWEDYDEPVKDLVKKDEFYRHLIANLPDTDWTGENEPTKSDVKDALEQTLDEIRQETEEYDREQAKWDEFERGRADWEDHKYY